MTPAVINGLGIAAFAGVIIVMFGLGLRRGRAVQATNEKIEENQRRMIANTERQIILAERSAGALERIATAIETTGTRV